MINNSIRQQVKIFNHLGCQLRGNRNYDLKNKSHTCNYLCRKIKWTLLDKSQQETILECYILLAV
jgi:hypothetical protein